MYHSNGRQLQYETGNRYRLQGCIIASAVCPTSKGCYGVGFGSYIPLTVSLQAGETGSDVGQTAYDYVLGAVQTRQFLCRTGSC